MGVGKEEEGHDTGGSPESIPGQIRKKRIIKAYASRHTWTAIIYHTSVSHQFTSFHDWKARPSGREKGGT